LATPIKNPFGATKGQKFSKPTFVDIDGDGLIDEFVGDISGSVRFFKNTGSKTAPAFAAPATNPFGLTSVNFNSAPAFADIDGDGLVDALIGTGSGHFIFFKNTAARVPLNSPLRRQSVRND